MQVTAETIRMMFTRAPTWSGVAIVPNARVSGRSSAEVMKLIKPKLRIGPRRAKAVSPKRYRAPSRNSR